MGITQHAHGGDTVRAIVNLGLMREYVGRPGTGLMPIRGHSGVQGGAEMGAYATALPGGVPIDATSAERFSRLWGFDVPAEPGLTTVEALEAAGRGELDGFYCIGGNFLETMPDPARIEAALARIPLRIHSDIVTTTQMLVEPADTVYILPARTRYEQRGGGTETTTERRVVLSPHVPGHDVGEARSEWEMLLDFARAVKPQGRDALRFDDGAAIRAEIARAVPAYAPIAGLVRGGDQFQIGGARLFEDRVFATPDGKARFQPVAPPASAAEESARPDPGSSFILATRRGKQFNSMVQRDYDPLTGAERDHIFMSPQDAARLGLRSGDRVILRSATGSFHGRAFLDEVAPGTLQGHWPEVSILIRAGVTEPSGGVPDYNARVTVERAGP
jgi:anaerobic selenocysteine-containing dehydrogenase